ncbi:MAG: HDIG domain-containing protein [Geobacter sp.]|nr:HDIG domain-containing protein [Geobacter sp.]
MNPEVILAKYFSPLALPVILLHSRAVADKALQIAASYGKPVDLQFIEEAAMLHDIGVAMTDAPSLDCHGTAPYICHGVIGREILEREGLPRHALVCERHIGVGLTVADIRQQNLPLPLRDMLPESTEERIIACADLFYSKKKTNLTTAKSIEKIRVELARFGEGKVAIFDSWLREFSVCNCTGEVV